MFYIDRSGAVPLIKSTLLTVPHGFSTREGGISVLPHTKSLNLRFNCGDADDIVNENYRLFTGAVGGSGAHTRMSQVHGCKVVYASACAADESTVDAFGIDTASVGEIPVCDGLVTDKHGLTLIARSADCGTILLTDGSIAAAVHAGWRGTVLKIAAAAVEAMVKLGAKPESITAALGPCIRRCCFEVGGDVADAFNDAGLSGFIEKSDGADKYHADIAAANAFVLCKAGVPHSRIDTAPQCTKCEPSRFFSHRAHGELRGVSGAAIALPDI